MYCTVLCCVGKLVYQNTKYSFRIDSLLNVYKVQPTRSKRIYFLRKLLQDGVGGNGDADDFEGDNNRADAPAPIPAALALLMNTTKFIDMAPGRSFIREFFLQFLWMARDGFI